MPHVLLELAYPFLHFERDLDVLGARRLRYLLAAPVRRPDAIPQRFGQREPMALTAPHGGRYGLVTAGPVAGMLAVRRRHVEAAICVHGDLRRDAKILKASHQGLRAFNGGNVSLGVGHPGSPPLIIRSAQSRMCCQRFAGSSG